MCTIVLYSLLQYNSWVDRSAAMVTMYEDGHTMEAVGEHFGVSRQRVHQIFSALGIPARIPRSLSLRDNHDLFWRRVAIRSANECWEWRGSRLPTGYGMLRWGHRKIYSHRLAFALAYGVLPKWLRVLHRCDNPPCCNPAHLWAGTDLENMRDRDEKGRDRYGPNAPGNWLNGQFVGVSP